MLGRAPSHCKFLAATFITAALTFFSLTAQEARTDQYVRLGAGSGRGCLVFTETTDKALENKQYRQAYAGYTKAIEWVEKTCNGKVTLWNLNLWGNYNNRVKASLGLGDVERAAADLAKMLESQPLRFSDSELKTAVAALDAAIKRQPKNTSFRGGLAEVYRLKGDYASALVERNAQVELLRTKAERAKALAARHYTHKALKKPERALEDISRAIDLEPKRWLSYETRAEIHRELDQILKKGTFFFSQESAWATKRRGLDPGDSRAVDSRVGRIYNLSLRHIQGRL